MRKLARELEGTGQADWAGVGYVQIDGSTDHRDRRDACQRFKNDPCIRVALLSVMAAGKGPDHAYLSCLSRCLHPNLPNCLNSHFSW